MSFFDLYNKRSSIRLTERLLAEIQNSVAVFKPSKSLNVLTELSEEVSEDIPIAEIDIVISGGGMRGYFMTGCSSILKNELNKRNIKIARISGARLPRAIIFNFTIF